jgi:hypothetical protein
VSDESSGLLLTQTKIWKACCSTRFETFQLLKAALPHDLSAFPLSQLHVHVSVPVQQPQNQLAFSFEIRHTALQYLSALPHVLARLTMMPLWKAGPDVSGQKV